MTDRDISSQRPKNVTLATQLLWGSLILGIFNTALNWNDQIARMPADFPFNKEVFSISLSAFTFTLLTWMFYKISTGRNWARIVFLCFYIIGLPFFVPQLTDIYNQSKIVAIIAVVLTIVQLIALVILFSNEGSAWFKAQKEVKKPEKK